MRYGDVVIIGTSEKVEVLELDFFILAWYIQLF